MDEYDSGWCVFMGCYRVIERDWNSFDKTKLRSVKDANSENALKTAIYKIRLTKDDCGVILGSNNSTNQNTTTAFSLGKGAGNKDAAHRSLCQIHYESLNP